MKSRLGSCIGATYVVLNLLTSPTSHGAIVTYAGSQLNVGDFRTTTVTKTLDIDGNNVYGTDGYYFWGTSKPPVNELTFASPSYISHVGVSSTTVSGLTVIEGAYGTMDDPTLPPGPSVSDITPGIVGGVGTGNLFEFHLSGSPWPHTVRMGISLLGDTEHPLSLTVFTYDPGLAAVTSLATASVSSPAGYGPPDFYFFDLRNVPANEWIVLYGTANTGSPFNFNFISGVTFDSVVPEPSTALLFGIGGGLLWMRKKTKRG